MKRDLARLIDEAPAGGHVVLRLLEAAVDQPGGIVGRDEPAVLGHEGRIHHRQPLGQVRVAAQQVVGVADGADAGDAGELPVAAGLADPADVGDVPLGQLVPAHELAVGQHDAVVARLGRPVQERQGVFDVLIHQQVRGQVNPAVLQRCGVGFQSRCHRCSHRSQRGQNAQGLLHGCLRFLMVSTTQNVISLLQPWHVSPHDHTMLGELDVAAICKPPSSLSFLRPRTPSLPPRTESRMSHRAESQSVDRSAG